MKNVKRSIHISEELVKKIESILKSNPDLDFNLVVSQALEQWLKGSQPINLPSSHLVVFSLR